MAVTVKLRDTDQKVRDFFNARRSSAEECVIQDDNDQAVAAVLPAKQYQTYQEYLRRRERNFAVLDRIREKMKDVDPDELQARIDQAVEEVKAKSRPRVGAS